MSSQYSTMAHYHKSPPPPVRRRPLPDVLSSPTAVNVYVARTHPCLRWICAHSAADRLAPPTAYPSRQGGTPPPSAEATEEEHLVEHCS